VKDLSAWTPRQAPAREALDGRWCRLEPLDPASHGDALFAASMADGAEDRHRWLFEGATDRGGFDRWMAARAESDDPLFFAVLDRATDRAEGRRALMRVDRAHGVIEIGNILWGPAIARTRVATEALFLFAKHAFDTLGYRRFEWKCNNLNEPSKKAALRFGFRFEGLFRNHMVVKGQNRDTAWFAMTDGDWPPIRRAFEGWLAETNFDAAGQQKRPLAAFMGRRL
jgi:RimJ/RimL family protein N-acetyltransferase